MSRFADNVPPLKALALLFVALALATAGCSTVKEAVVGEPQAPPVLKLEVQAPKPLAELLQQFLDLGRVNRLAQGEPLQEGELDRLVAAAPQQARDLLDTEGYYNATIDVQRVPGTQPPVVRVSIDPGPRTVVGTLRLDVDGPLQRPSEADAAHARQTLKILRDDWPLKAGDAFRDADWSRAKTGGIATLRAQGYVDANWASTLARVDAALQRADLTLRAASGPLYRIGSLRIGGLRRQDESTVRHIADLDIGVPATETVVLDIQERLQTSDLFDRATVSYQTDPARPEATVVDIQLGERQLQEATVGIGVSANVGARLTLDHVHRRPFDRPWIARSKLDLSRLQQRVETELSTQTLANLYRNLVGAAAERVKSDTDTVTSYRLRAGRAQDTRRIDRQLFVEYQHSTTESVRGTERADALALQFQGIWRKVDDPLLPTRGHVWQGQFGAGWARSDPGTNGPFGRIWARYDLYRPLGGGWFGQGRLELGQVLARSEVRVPEALRFRAGGDESVRGYAYRSLTSRVDGVDVGGNVIFTGSLEAARPILARFPQLWGAVFVDAGRAAMNWAELDPAWGVGVGLRYRSPVGPVKLDLAWGQEVRRLRLHLSVGVAF